MKVFLPKPFLGKTLDWMERAAWTLSLGALTYCGFAVGEAEWAQRQGRDELRKVQWTSRRAWTTPTALRTQTKSDPGAALGSLEMKASGLSGVIFDGADAFTLGRGIGHLPGSAMPGERGNTVLAGHRDTFFRNLEHVTVGEHLTIETPSAVSTYAITAIGVVGPRETSVMRPTSDSRITLITCYPFDFFGHAPQRFVVTGKLITP